MPFRRRHTDLEGHETPVAQCASRERNQAPIPATTPRLNAYRANVRPRAARPHRLLTPMTTTVITPTSPGTREEPPRAACPRARPPTDSLARPHLFPRLARVKCDPAGTYRARVRVGAKYRSTRGPLAPIALCSRTACIRCTGMGPSSPSTSVDARAGRENRHGVVQQEDRVAALCRGLVSDGARASRELLVPPGRGHGTTGHISRAENRAADANRVGNAVAPGLDCAVSVPRPSGVQGWKGVLRPSGVALQAGDAHQAARDLRRPATKNGPGSRGPGEILRVEGTWGPTPMRPASRLRRARGRQWQPDARHECERGQRRHPCGWRHASRKQSNVLFRLVTG